MHAISGYFGHEEDESVKMKCFNHPNVINLIAAFVDAGPASYIVMLFMDSGSLLSFLKKWNEITVSHNSIMLLCFSSGK